MSYPVCDVLEGRIDPRAFSDSVVFVGAYEQGMRDDFIVPNGGNTQMYGVEIHANIFQSFVEGRFAVNGSPFLLGLVFALVAMLDSSAIQKAQDMAVSHHIGFGYSC